MKTIKLSLCLLVAFVVPRYAHALINGPYTNDVSTLFLLHFDEAAGGSVTTNLGLKGGNFYTVTNTTTGNGVAEPPPVTTTLGYTSFSVSNPSNSVNFGNAVSGTNTDFPYTNGVVGFDGNKNGAFDADVQGSPASPDAIGLTNLNIGVGGASPFTLEALICPTVTNRNQEILCTDDYNGSRGFQFKITTGGQLQFQMITAPTVSLTPGIPSSGPNAFVPNTWYHVAVTYDGTTVTVYWTKLDPSMNFANPIGSTTWSATTASGAIAAPLIVGAENRGSVQESFLGLIDEVRISKVARGAGQMQFYSPGVVIVTDPASQGIDDSQPVTFSVVASSLTQLGYQWRFGGAGIPNATNASYSIASVVATNAGNYDVVVTNVSGSSATSHVATLTVGAGNFLSHRWSFNGDTTDSIGGATGTNVGNATVSGGSLVLDGTTNTYLNLPPHLLAGLSAVTFECWVALGANGNNDRIFDFGNTNFSSAGILPPEQYVYFSPRGGGNLNMGISGGSQQFQENASGVGALDNQLVHVTCVVDPPSSTMTIYTNGVFAAANTSLTVGISSLKDDLCWIGRSLFAADPFLLANIDEFRIYNGALNSNSIWQSQLQGAAIILNDGPVQITNQPASTTTAPGLSVTFSGLAVGHWPITYQWFENGSAIAGATNTSYSFTALSGQNGHTFQLVATNNILGTTYFSASTNATLTVVTPPTLVWLGQNSSAWDTSTLNWTNTSTATLVAYALLDSAIFDNRGSAVPTVNLTQSVNPLSVTVNSTANYTLVSSAANGGLTGSGSLTKANTGTLIIDVTNSMTGPVLISGGTLQIGNNDTNGAIASPVTNNASLVLDRSDSTVLPSPIYGTGSVTMNAGNVTASSSNSYTGPTIINSGVTVLGNAAGLGATNGAITVASGAELYITANADVGLKSLSLAGTGVSSAGALRKGGAGVTTYYGPITLAGDTTMSVDGNATLNLTNSGGVNATPNANLTLTGSNSTNNIAGPLSLGSGALTVSGGTWTVAPSNNYTGGTTLNSGGTLRITGVQSLGPVPGSPNASDVYFNTGGGLEAATNLTLNDGNIGIEFNANSTITVDSGATFTISNPISSTSGSVYMTKAGAGTLVLNGSNPFSGNIYVDTFSQTANDGMIVIANNNAIANLFAFAGIPSIFIRSQNSGASTFAMDGTSGSITVAPDISMSGRNNTTPQIENLAGNNTISGNFTIGSGGGIYALQSDSGTLTISAPLPYATPTNGPRSFTFTGAGYITMSAAITDGSSTGTSNIWINVIKNGAGLLSLPVANSYSGFTIVSNGVLLLNGGTIGSGPVTVSGGLLVGNGTIAGPVLVQPAGAIEAGATNTIGTLHLSGSLTLAGNTIVKINKSNSTQDLFSGQSSVTYGGTLTVTNLSGTLTTNDTFTLFSPGTAATNFTSIVGSPGPGLKYTFTNGVLGVAVGLANYPTNILFNVSSGVLTMTWPLTHEGWILQAQTNNLGVGLTAASNTWFDLSNTISSTQAVFNVSTTNPAVFYRLRHP